MFNLEHCGLCQQSDKALTGKTGAIFCVLWHEGRRRARDVGVVCSYAPAILIQIPGQQKSELRVR